MKKIVFIFLMLIVTCMSFAGIKDWFKKPDVWNADNITMVHLQDSTKWTCNPDNVIKQSTCDSIDLWCSKLKRDKGVESVIVIVKRVENEDCFRVAQDIGNKYGVGDKETRRGLVIVVAYRQHKYFFATGQGLEQDLTDATCNEIANDYLKPAMKDNDPDKAMLNSVKAIYNYLDYGVAELYKGQKEHDEMIAIIVIIVVIVIFIFLVWVTDGEILGGFSSSGGSGSSGGSFGGGSFGGGGAGGSW